MRDLILDCGLNNRIRILGVEHIDKRLFYYWRDAHE